MEKIDKIKKAVDDVTLSLAILRYQNVILDGTYKLLSEFNREISANLPTEQDILREMIAGFSHTKIISNASAQEIDARIGIKSIAGQDYRITIQKA